MPNGPLLPRKLNMPLDLANYEQKAADAIKAFWGNRAKAKQKQIESGVIDQG
jgi:hypothetical protein